MYDIVDKKTRSRNMSAIKGKNTKPEIEVRQFLHKNGLRFRLHRKDLPGRPDLVLSRYGSVVMVNGCFWHRHQGCKNSVMPKTNRQFWKEKLEGNVLRDKKNHNKLKKLGWSVFVVWECQINPTRLEKLCKDIRSKTIKK